MENYDIPNDSLWIYITSEKATSGIIEIPLMGYMQNFTVSANSFVKFHIPNSIGMNVGSEIIQYKGIHIIANDSVLVYILNQELSNNDGTAVLPINLLSNSYQCLSYLFYLPPLTSEILIVAIDSNTFIQIYLSDTTISGNNPGDTINVLLQKGETYQVQSYRDLTSTKILGNKFFALFSGHRNAFVPYNQCCADHLFEQMLPIDMWDSLYVVTPLQSRLYGDTYRILATQDTTDIYFNGTLVNSLNKNEFSEDTIINATSISSNKNFAIAQYSNSVTYDLTTGDPFMLQIWPFTLV